MEKSMRRLYSKIILFVIACIAVNVLGRCVAVALALPLWMDSIGTVFSSYLLGPFCGAIVGVSGNLVYGIFSQSSVIYGITSICIALIVGFTAGRKHYDTFFGIMSIATFVTLASMAVSVPLNFILSGGMTGNIWGNAVIQYLEEHHVGVIRYPVGQFYIEFADKILTMFLLFLYVQGRKTVMQKKKGEKKKTVRTRAVLSVLVFLAASSSFFVSVPASAKQKTYEDLDYKSYIQTIYNNKSGLPCGEANDITQGKDGILWIGTYAGLYRYNGREFRWMDKYESVKNVNCLYTDEEDRVWIGTNDSGLSICINEKIVNVLRTKDGLPSDTVYCITGGADGSYYIGTAEGLVVLTLENGIHIVKKYSELSSVDSIAVDTEGNAALVDSEGVVWLIGGGEIKSRFRLEGEEEYYTSVCFDDENRLYAGTSGDSLYRFEKKEDRFEKEKSFGLSGLTNMNSLFFNEKTGAVFVCADNGVAFLDRQEKVQRLNMVGFENSVENMEIDYQGNLWFASSRLGLIKFTESGVSDLYQTAGLEKNVVNAVQEWQGYLYCGTDTGLDIIQKKKYAKVENKFTKLFQGIRIRCMAVDSENHLWVCTYGKGVAKLSPAGDVKFYDESDGIFGSRARVVIQYSDGIAAAGVGGITLFHRDGRLETISGSNGSAQILCLLEGKNGVLYAGTDGEGIAVIEDGKIQKYITYNDGLSSNVILRMTGSEKEDVIYIVSSNGICCLDAEENVRTLDTFPYFNNYDICLNKDGKIFAPGSSGIYVVDEKELLEGKENMAPELLNAEWGITSSLTANAWNYVDEEGNYYISSSTGVFQMNINHYALERRSYRMRVSSVRMDGASREVERGTPIKVSRDVDKITFASEIINYTAEEPYISYKLEGFDKNSTIVPLQKLSDITYTNLPSGTYTFRLSVLDRDRKTVIEESKYILVKEKAFHDNDWFVVYMIFIALITVAWLTWLIFRTQIQRTLKAQKQQIEFAESQIRMSNETILTIAKTLDARDENTSQHSERVSQYAVMIAEEIGFDKERCENLRKAALLHDIGKIGIPDHILNKPARLTDEEYAIMKTHVSKGAEILKNFTTIDNVVEGALYHHERYDGRGYIHGLKGEEIPIYGRIIGVADAFDAMTANRVYRKQLNIDFVLGELEHCKGTQFDPEFAEIMIHLVKSGRVDVEELYHSSIETAKTPKEGEA